MLGRKTGTGGFTDRGEMKRLPEFRERGNLGVGTMLCRPENQGEKNILVLKLKKKSVSDKSGDKVASAQISVDQPPLCLVSNHWIWGFQTKLTFDLNSIFEKFEIKIKFENCCILKERKNCSMTLY